MFTHAMIFANPLWLLLLLFVPVAVWVQGRRGRPAIYFPSSQLVSDLPLSVWQRIAWLPGALRALSLMLLIVALARPQLPNEKTRVYAEGIAIQMVVDCSISMYAPDFELDGRSATRLDVVKDVFRRFVLGDRQLPGRPDDLIGVVTFANFPDVKCPLTLSHESAVQALDHAHRATGSEGGTNIGDAVAWALEDLRQAQAKSKVLVLLSDGVNQPQIVEGLPPPLDPLEAARLAQGLGVRIYTVGAGNKVGIFRFQDPETGEMQRAHADPVNDSLLSQMAEVTGGKYFRASDTEGLREIYGEIDRLERTRTESVQYLDYRELFAPLAWFALAVFCLEQLLAATRLQRIP